MIVSSGIVTAAKRLGSKKLAQGVTPGERFTQVDAVVDLLAGSTSTAAQRGARDLLWDMSTNPWQVIRGAHKSPGDSRLHVTIEVSGRRYHLLLDANSCVYDITYVEHKETKRPAGSKPWVGPGA